jgi:hypothetical protein
MKIIIVQNDNTDITINGGFTQVIPTVDYNTPDWEKYLKWYGEYYTPVGVPFNIIEKSVLESLDSHIDDFIWDFSTPDGYGSENKIPYKEFLEENI